ncbi:MAG: hypothetical protein RL154_660, partial [Pseudomonadota bacterium]
SPAYFCNISSDVKYSEIVIFNSHQKLWFKQFYSKCGAIKSYCSSVNATEENLKKLFYYNWSKDNFNILSQKGISIDIFFGSDDKILQIDDAIEFFKPFVRQIFLIKNASHTLKNLPNCHSELV